MLSIRAFPSQPLEWRQPSRLHHSYELWAGAELVASLRWSKVVGSLALGEAAEGAWTLKRTGFLNPRVTLRVHGAEANLAVFSPGWRGAGVLEYVDDHKYQWAGVTFWGSEWVFTSPFGAELVHVRPETPPLREAGEGRALVVAYTRFEPAAATDPHLPQLVLLGWYLLVLMAEDDKVMTGAI